MIFSCYLSCFWNDLILMEYFWVPLFLPLTSLDELVLIIISNGSMMSQTIIIMALTATRANTIIISIGSRMTWQRTCRYLITDWESVFLSNVSYLILLSALIEFKIFYLLSIKIVYLFIILFLKLAKGIYITSRGCHRKPSLYQSTKNDLIQTV